MSIVAVAGSAFTFYIPGLEDQANAGLFKSSPTIAAADFTLSINGGAFDSLDNTPTVAPAGGTQIQIILSATETAAAADGGKITVVCADAAGAEWYSAGFVIDVRAADLPTAEEVVAAIDADPPGVDLQLWLGGTPDLLNPSGKVNATISGETVSAHVVRYNYQWMYQANVTSVLGNVLTASGGIKDPESTALADDSLVALVGWQVMFAKTVAGVPTVEVFWRTTIVSYTLTTITVEDMPAQNLSSGGFTAYILPPGFGAAAGGATPQEVWEYTTRTLTQSSTSTTDSTAAGTISRRRGDSWSISLTVGAITGYTSLWFTLKHSNADADSAAVLQIKLNASTTDDGLLYVNGTAASNDALGSITVSDAATGAIVIAVDESITDDLPVAALYYDVQALISGSVSTPESGTFTITADVTRSIT